MSTEPPHEQNSTKKFGPSVVMLWMGVLVHPVAWAAAAGGAFTLSMPFRAWLWQWNFAPWRRLLLSSWDFVQAHPSAWLGLLFVAGAHVLIRYLTCSYSYDENYLYVQTGLLAWGAPGGPFRIFNDPIAFTQVVDANDQRGLLGLLTGTGTLFVKTNERPGYLRLSWVPDVKAASSEILSRAGVKSARVLSSV